MCRDFLSLCGLSLHPLEGFFTDRKSLILMKSNELLFSFEDCTFGLIQDFVFTEWNIARFWISFVMHSFPKEDIKNVFENVDVNSKNSHV